MLDLVGASFLGLLMQLFGKEPAKLETLQLLSWQKSEIFNLPTQADPNVEKIVTKYLQDLKAKGYLTEKQGVWIQSDWAYLADHQGTVPISAASLTKIATTLAALEKWGGNHRFSTNIYTTGAVKNGVVQGDLIIQGSNDPLFVWEEAIALGNSLNQLGIRQIKGNLVIVGDFAMNFNSKALPAGQMLKQSLHSRLWTPILVKSHGLMLPNTPKPEVAIAGTVTTASQIPTTAQLQIKHQSLTLAEIIKQMNIYSNNAIAEMLAQGVGGAQIVAQTAAKAAQVPETEIQLINGSGLGVDNRISPRAASGMLIALARRLESQPLAVADLFPMSGRDRHGTMLSRSIPQGVVIKTGTLNEVSALAGIIPTQERGQVWFAIINHGGKIEQLRAEQDRLLQNLGQHWQLMPISGKNTTHDYFGNPKRNLKELS